MSFDDGTRVLSGTPTATQSTKSYTYKVTDRDGDKATDVFTIEVEANTSPSLTETSDQTWVQNVSVSLTLPESSAGNQPLTYTLTGTPPTGVTFKADTRTLSGRPTGTQNATTYTYKVTDKDGEEAADEFTIAVEADSNPTLTAPSDQSWVKGIAVSLTLPAASNGNSPLTYTLANLPTGVSFDADTRVLSGTPTGTRNPKTYTYKVRDKDGDQETAKFTIKVEDDTNPTFNLTSTKLVWVKDVAVALTLPAASGGNKPLTYTVAGSLPPGVSFNAATQVVSGTPTAVQTTTTYTYKVRDKDGDEVTDKFSIEVEADTSPTLTATSDQTWERGTAVSLTLPAASDGNAPLTYTLSGSPPPGVSYNTATRVLSGTPSAVRSMASYTYKVRDKDGDEASDVFTITVNPPPGLRFAPSRVTVAEEGTSTYTVALTVQPNSNVTVSVTVAAGGDADLTVTPTSLQFTTTNWKDPQRITVSAAKDEDDTDGTATLKHTVSGSSEYANVTGFVYASEIDDDRAEPESGPCALIPQDKALTLPLFEGVPFFPAGPSLTSDDRALRVRLPTARTTLAPILSWHYKLDYYNTESQLGTWVSVPEVWFMDRTVSVTVNDSQALPPASGEPATPVETLEKELLFSRAELPVARGSAASYAVRLATEPTSDVTLTVARLDGAEDGLTASPGPAQIQHHQLERGPDRDCRGSRGGGRVPWERPLRTARPEVGTTA